MIKDFDIKTFLGAFETLGSNMGPPRPLPRGFDIQDLQRELRQGMHHSGDESRAFIEYSRLQAIWDKVDIRRLFPRDEWTDKDVDIIRRQYLKLLSTLILIGWPGVCQQSKAVPFRIFLEHCTDTCNDAKMPVADGHFPFLRGTEITLLTSNPVC